MHPPCEIVIKVVLPAFRSLVARRLRDYGMPQTEIAGLLGITQASISFYLSNRRGKNIELLESNPRITELADMAARLLKDGVDDIELERIFCEVCTIVRNSRRTKDLEAFLNNNGKRVKISVDLGEGGDRV